MSLNGSMRATAQGLTAERARMDLISVNLANANSMSTPAGEAFRRHVAILEGTPDGPKVVRIQADPSPLQVKLDPGNPFSNVRGEVFYSNVQPIHEMVDMMSAQRSYEANIAAFNAAKGMNKSALNIGRA